MTDPFYAQVQERVQQEGDYRGALQLLGNARFVPGDGSWTEWVFRQMHYAHCNHSQRQEGDPHNNKDIDQEDTTAAAAAVAYLFRLSEKHDSVDVFLQEASSAMDAKAALEDNDDNDDDKDDDCKWSCFVDLCRVFHQPPLPIVYYANFQRRKPLELANALGAIPEGMSVLLHHYPNLLSTTKDDLKTTTTTTTTTTLKATSTPQSSSSSDAFQKQENPTDSQQQQQQRREQTLPEPKSFTFEDEQTDEPHYNTMMMMNMMNMMALPPSTTTAAEGTSTTTTNTTTTSSSSMATTTLKDDLEDFGDLLQLFMEENSRNEDASVERKDILWFLKELDWRFRRIQETHCNNSDDDNDNNNNVDHEKAAENKTENVANQQPQQQEKDKDDSELEMLRRKVAELELQAKKHQQEQQEQQQQQQQQKQQQHQKSLSDDNMAGQDTKEWNEWTGTEVTTTPSTTTTTTTSDNHNDTPESGDDDKQQKVEDDLRMQITRMKQNHEMARRADQARIQYLEQILNERERQRPRPSTTTTTSSSSSCGGRPRVFQTPCAAVEKAQPITTPTTTATTAPVAAGRRRRHDKTPNGSFLVDTPTSPSGGRMDITVQDFEQLANDLERSEEQRAQALEDLQMEREFYAEKMRQLQSALRNMVQEHQPTC